MKLTSATTTYEIDVEDLRKHFSEQFEVAAERVVVEPINREISDVYDRYSTTKFVGLKITIKGDVK